MNALIGTLNQQIEERIDGVLSGLQTIIAARKRIVARLEEFGFLEKIEPNTHAVPHGDRSGVVIEPWLTDGSSSE